MDATDIATIAEHATTRFRLESLAQYLVPQEADDLAAWRNGTWTLPSPETSPWLAHIRDTTAVGATWQRVRILDHPLSEYSEFELYGYQANAAAGESILVADRAWSSDLALFEEDFWIFDDTVVQMSYDSDGCFLGAAIAPDSTPYRQMWETALRHSIPLASFLDHHEPRLTA